MNLRVIKKDIDFVIDELIGDSLLTLTFGKDIDPAYVEGIINEALELRDELYERVNHPDKSKIKAHYSQITEDLYEKTDELFNKLSKRP